MSSEDLSMTASNDTHITGAIPDPTSPLTGSSNTPGETGAAEGQSVTAEQLKEQLISANKKFDQANKANLAFLDLATSPICPICGSDMPRKSADTKEGVVVVQCVVATCANFGRAFEYELPRVRLRPL